MNSELFEALELLEKEKGISTDYMLERVEAALVSAYKRDRNGLANVRVDINKEKQDIRMFEQKTIVEEVLDEELEITHRAASRQIFVNGALHMARLLPGKPNQVYDLQKILFGE